MAQLRRDGLALHYEEHGAGTPILGIHGSPSTSAFWHDAALELAARGRCITYDRRGFHRSPLDPPAATIDLVEQLDDVAALLAELDASPAVVIGRSTGGLIALALAVRRPELVRALVLLEPAVFALTPEARRWAGELREAVLTAAAEDVGTVSRTVFERALGPEVWPSLPGEIAEVLADGGATVAAETRGHGLDLSLDPFAPSAAELAAVLQPTLVLTATDSYEVGRGVDEALVGLLPDSRHHIVGGGHLIDPAHPLVLEFVTDVARDQPSGGGA